MRRRSTMTRRSAMGSVLAMLLVVTACGGDDDPATQPADTSTEVGESESSEMPESSVDDTDSAAASADVVNTAPAGQATASVDGLDLSFETPGGVECSISEDSITFSYVIGDNEVVLGGGMNPADGGWIGGIDLRVANPEDEPGPIGYYPTPGQDGMIPDSHVAVDGQSMSYSGPMLKQPANDGSLPPPVDVGEGTISATC